jgi:hypothetical protein
MMGEIKTRRREMPDEKYAPTHLLSVSPPPRAIIEKERKNEFFVIRVARTLD